MTIPSSFAPAPRFFQFRIATMLMLMVWAGLVCVGLRSPTRLWSGVIGQLTLIFVLTVAVVAIYRTGRERAMAVGFLFFCVGYLTYLTVLSGTLTQGLESDWTPSGGAFGTLFEIIHLDQESVGSSPRAASGEAVYPYRTEFIAISNHALACLLGLTGAIAAQFLHATQRGVHQSE